MIAIQIQENKSKEDGEAVKFVEVKLTKNDGFGLDSNYKFEDSKQARKFIGKVVRRSKRRGQLYYIASAMLRKHQAKLENQSLNNLKEQFNGSI